MQIGRVAVLGVALGAGAIAAFLAFNFINRPAENGPAPEQATVQAVQVLVARNDIPMGSTVADGAVEWIDWPANGTSSNFMTKASNPDAAESVVGSIARATVYAGEPIVDAKLIHSDRGYMSAILPAGKRAVATKITADTSAGGFILPNDHVDVIMTRQGGDNGAASYLTETILNDVRVLAIDQTIEDRNGEKVVVGQTATLELTPQQAEILTVAQQMSDHLTLALRSIADAETGPTGKDAFHLIGGQSGTVTMVKSGVAKEVNGLK